MKKNVFDKRIWRKAGQGTASYFNKAPFATKASLFQKYQDKKAFFFPLAHHYSTVRPQKSLIKKEKNFGYIPIKNADAKKSIKQKLGERKYSTASESQETTALAHREKGIMLEYTLRRLYNSAQRLLFDDIQKLETSLRTLKQERSMEIEIIEKEKPTEDRHLALITWERRKYESYKKYKHHVKEFEQQIRTKRDTLEQSHSPEQKQIYDAMNSENALFRELYSQNKNPKSSEKSDKKETLSSTTGNTPKTDEIKSMWQSFVKDVSAFIKSLWSESE